MGLGTCTRYCLIFFILKNSFLLESNSGCIGEDEICSICTCFNSSSVVDCSGIGLYEIPKLLPFNLTTIILSHNNISTVDVNSFNNCTNMEVLDLNSNSISSLPDELFAELGSSLTTIYLQNNELIMNENSTIFRPLNQSLKILYVYNNHPIPYEVLDGLYSLEILHLDGDMIGGFGASFAGLKSLKEIRVYAPLHHLTNDTFVYMRGCANLTKLDISDVGIQSMESRCFEPLRSLLSLNLGYNNRQSLENVSTVLDSLPDRLEELILTGLIGNYRPTLTLSTNIIDKLRKKSLRKLKLNKNDIIYIENSFTTALSGLEYLDISFNRYSNTFSIVGMAFIMVNMSYFNGNMQSMRPKFDAPDEFNPRSRGINSKPKDQSKRFSNFFSPPKSIYSRNTCVAGKFRACTFPIFADLGDFSWCIPVPRSLKIIEIDGSLNEKLVEQPPVIFLGNFQIEEIYSGSNGLEMLRGPFIVDRPKSVKPIKIDYSYNSLYCIAPDVLDISIGRGMIIGQLNLEGNDLSDQLREDKDGDTFASYVNLTELNLANNKIKFLNFKSFWNLQNLIILNLSANSLQLLEFDILSLKNLRHLDLSNNLFVMFDGGLTSNLTNIAYERGFDGLSLSIQGNPFQCSCFSLDFLHWMSKNETKINDLKEVMCLYDSISIPMTSFSDKMKDMFLICHSLPLKIFGGLLALAIVCTLLGIVSYRYRWDIRYYLLRHHQLKKKYLLLSERESSYLYDAFVSYDMEDRRWIVQELMANIECNYDSSSRSSSKRHGRKSYGSMDRSAVGGCSSQLVDDGVEVKVTKKTDDGPYFKLCIHERDFEPGNLIESNILHAIQKSRMVILVVTSHFVKSNWCRLELEMAKMESLERGRNVVIVVLLEPLQETLESLEWLMRRYTYMEWFKCNTDNKKKVFWKALKVSLGSLKIKKSDIIN